MDLTKILALVALAAFVGAYYLMDKHRKEKKDGDAHGIELDDLTSKARQGKLGTVIGMDEVVERVLHVIARKTKNNPLLIGEPGVGKTAVVEGLAQRIVSGEVPEQFRHKRIVSLNVSELMAGTKYRGELEGRLQALLKSLETEERGVILFIDEIHMIEQARGSEGSVDIADVLKPALSRGELQVIGATTWNEYLQYLKPDTAFDRRFQPVLVHEPSRENAIKILSGVKKSYEDFHHVCIPEETVVAAVEASLKIKDRFLPDKAFDLIDEACAKVSIEGSHGHACAFGLVHAASERAKKACPEGVAMVMPEDVQDIATEWNTPPNKKSA